MKFSLILHLRALAYVLNLTRFSLLLLIAVTGLLTVDQGQDLLIKIVRDSEPRALQIRVLLLLSTLLWSFSIWLWTRVLLDIQFPDPPVEQALLTPYRKHLPRLLSALAFAAVAFNLYRAEGGLHWLTIAIATLGAVFWIVLIYRRSFGQKIATRMRPQDPHAFWTWAPDMAAGSGPVQTGLRSTLGSLRGKFAFALLTLGIALFVWGLADPLSLGWRVNAVVLLMLWGATLLPAGSLLTYAANRIGIPLITVVIILAFLFSAYNDNHAIRGIGNGPTPDTRVDIETAVDDWHKAYCASGSCPRFVVVATAGGGIRAAYWTATVLGTLNDDPRLRKFGKQLFAISGVSGGSVGAAVYRAAVLGAKDGKVSNPIAKVLASDFLGPIAAGLLFPDFVQRFLPWPVLRDRAAVFEQAIERSGREHLGNDLLAGPLSALNPERPWPALFLNSTWSNNGRRIVGATLAPVAGKVLYQDLRQAIGYDIATSTAAHNSARFPYVSPPGSWPMPTKTRDGQWQDSKQRLQDGGLFENFGAETALEILKIAHQRLGGEFRPLVILISSDPNLNENIAPPEPRKPFPFAYELLTTVQTFINTRVGRGAVAASRLKNWTREVAGDDERVFAYFRMCRTGNSDNPPLGWSLSDQARETIAGYLIGDSPCTGNKAALDTVIASLNTP